MNKATYNGEMLNFNDLIIGTFDNGFEWLQQQKDKASPESYEAAVNNWEELKSHNWFVDG